MHADGDHASILALKSLIWYAVSRSEYVIFTDVVIFSAVKFSTVEYSLFNYGLWDMSCVCTVRVCMF